MSPPRKRFVLLPLGLLAMVAVAIFILGRSGVIELPMVSPKALASENGEGGEEKPADADSEEEEVIPVPVELARAESRHISAYYRASSVIEADRQVGVVAKIAGRVQKVAVEEGDWVEEGSVLAELENARERIQLRQAELKLEDEARELRRREALLKQNLITQEEFDVTKSAFDLAETERDLAAIRLEETLIRAPFDGQVTDRMIVPGQHINMSEPVFTLVDFEPLRVRIHLPEIIARKIRPGDEVDIVVEAIAKPVPAVVERIAPVVDPTTSTVKLTLLVQGQQEKLRVGGFVKVRVTTDTHVEALSIPKLALVEEGGLQSVFIAEADTVRKVEVTTGLYDETHCEVLDGIEEGWAVVSLGQGGLRTGSKIEVLNAAEVGWVAPQTEEDAKKGEGSEVAEPEADAAEPEASDTQVAIGEQSDAETDDAE